MTIRRAAPEDLDLLESLERASFPDHWSRQTLFNSLVEPNYLVLLAGDCGFLLGWNVGEEAELARLGVAQAARGRGTGLALVQAALEEWKARSVASVFLEVRASNEVAVRLYRRAGFQEIARRPNYYANGEEARVMKRELSGE